MSERKVFIKTFGCQMNVYDSERMLAALASDGYAQTDRAEDADLVIFNTCHIREKAAEKVYSDLGRLKPLKLTKPDLQIGIAGCVAQAEGAEIVRRQPMVDLVVGPQAYHRLPALLREIGDDNAVVDTDFPAEDKFDHLPDGRKSLPLSAFLSVQEGCDKFCTFCVVPYTRGMERSRPVEKILTEARDMVARGVREITLLGQNVNGYHGADADGREIGLGELIARLAMIDDLLRIRFTTSHPIDMDDALYEAFRDIPKLMPFMHLPIQSGSDPILQAMNRHHNRADYIKAVERLRAARPDIALSGDFIVGFPGETEADFQATLSIIDEVGQAHGFSFKYSPRPGTPAAAMEQVEERLKEERLSRLQEAIYTAQDRFLAGLDGQELPVMWEAPAKRAGQVSGRSPYLFPVVANAANRPQPSPFGLIERVTIASHTRGTLIASD